MRALTTLFLVVIILVGITFACLNASPARINYYMGELQAPLSLLLAMSLAIGVLIGFFLGFVLYWQVKCKNRRLSKRIKLAEKEIENIRAIPLKENR